MSKFNRIQFTIESYEEYQRFVKCLAVAGGSNEYQLTDQDKDFAQKLCKGTVKAHRNLGQILNI
jgi:hypothetical protein